ncbi:MAG: nucleotidyltransferase family protein, partial [Myxococcales bacterium]
NTTSRLQRSSTLSAGGAPLRVLAPADELVHLCVHAAAHWFEGVKWLFDLKLLLATRQIAWPEVVEEARRARVAAAVGLTLRMAAERVNAQVPPDVLDALGPAPLRRLACARLLQLKPSVRAYLFEVLFSDGVSARWAVRLAAVPLERAARAAGLGEQLARVWRRRPEADR